MSITSRINEMSSHIEQAYNELQGLGADLTNVNKNIENISMVLDDIYDSMPQVSGEGTSLTLEDTRVGKIKSTLKGNTSQTGTPTPSSPIPVNVVSGDNEINVVGKNLCKIETHTYQDLSRAPSVGQPLPLFNTNGTIKIKIDLSTFDKSKTYTVSARNDITNLRCFYCDDNDLYITAESTNNPKTLSIPTNASVLYIFIKISNVTDLTPVPLEDYELQIEVGSSATTYEPYIGNTYNIDLPVENLFDKDNATLNYRLDGSGQPYADNSCALSDYIEVLPSTNYSYSTGTTRGGASAICYYDSNKTFISRTLPIISNDLSGTMVTPNNAKYVRITDIKSSIDTWQFEKGSKANSYTPYGTTPIELCKIGNYQDYIYKDNDKWYKYKAIHHLVLKGSTNWIYQTDYTRFIATLANKPINNSPAYSNFYINGQTMGNNNYFSLASASNYSQLLVHDERFTTKEDYNEWLSNNNAEFYYALLTPTTEEITYQPLIDQLNLLEQVMSKGGQTNISQVNNDLPFIISASALKEWQESTSLNSTLSMVNPLSLGNTLNTQEIENNTQPIEVGNIERLEEEENEES